MGRINPRVGRRLVSDRISYVKHWSLQNIMLIYILFISSSNIFSSDFSKFELDIDHQINVGHNKASIRYVEKITTTDKVSFGTFGSTSSSSEYPYIQTFYQHEHALITVNDDCRIILWDQYGDNKEQEDVSNEASFFQIFLGNHGVEIFYRPFFPKK